MYTENPWPGRRGGGGGGGEYVMHTHTQFSMVCMRITIYITSICTSVQTLCPWLLHTDNMTHTKMSKINTKWIKLEHLPLTCNHGCNMELNIWEIIWLTPDDAGIIPIFTTRNIQILGWRGWGGGGWGKYHRKQYTLRTQHWQTKFSNLWNCNETNTGNARQEDVATWKCDGMK